MFLMTPRGECMCGLIDFMLAIPCIYIKAFNGESFTAAHAFTVISICFECSISTQRAASVHIDDKENKEQIRACDCF